MEQRKIDEIEFHNSIRLVSDDPHVADTRWSKEMEKTIKENPLWVNMKYYSIERSSRQFILDWFKQNCYGKIVLDLCCGNGEDSIYLAKECNASVIGCDLSDVSIENCQKLAEKEGVSEKAKFEIQDAENLTYPDNTFDCVTEYGSLHHVDLPKVYAEMARVLKPNGLGLCNETLGHNILIHTYRLMTPKLRTPWEVAHILKKPQIDLARKYFKNVKVRHYYLASIAAVPFRNTILFNPILTFLEWIDKALLAIPGLKWQCWQVVIELRDPIKS